VAFTSFGTVEAVVRRYGIREAAEEFVAPGPHPPARDHYLADMREVLETSAFQRSEAFTREAVVFPTLREVWRHYTAHLSLFSHEPVAADADLRGELDYMVCRRSRHGPFTPDQPILLVGEAKKDDLDAGWALALAGMLLAARRLAPAPLLYGLAVSRSAWEFGRLSDDSFTRDPRTYGLSDVPGLIAALHFVFAACRDQVLAMPPAAA
jgi:hypothetical protein